MHGREMRGTWFVAILVVVLGVNAAAQQTGAGGEGATQLVLQGSHRAPVLALDWSPRGTLLASGDADGVVKVWTADGVLVSTTYAFRTPVSTVRFLSEERFVAATSRKSLGNLRLGDYEQEELFGDEPWYQRRLGPSLRVYTVDGSLSAEATELTDDAYDVAVSHSERRIIVLTESLRSMDYTLGDTEDIPTQGRPFGIAMSPDGRSLAVAATYDGHYSSLVIRSLDRLPTRTVFSESGMQFQMIAADPTGAFLSTGGIEGGAILYPYDGTWEYGPEVTPRTFLRAANAYFLHDFVFTADGMRIITTTDRAPTYLKAFSRRGAQQWEIELEQLGLSGFETLGYASVAAHPIKPLIAVGTVDGRISVLSSEEAPQVLPPSWGTTFASIADIAVATGEAAIAVATDQGVYEVTLDDLAVHHISDQPARWVGYHRDGLEYYALIAEGSNRQDYGYEGFEEETVKPDRFGLVRADRSVVERAEQLIGGRAGVGTVWELQDPKRPFRTPELEYLRVGGETPARLRFSDADRYFQATLDHRGDRVAVLWGTHGTQTASLQAGRLEIAVWPVGSPRITGGIALDAPALAVAFAPDGTLLVLDGNSVLHLITEGTPNLHVPLQEEVDAACWAGSGRIIAAARGEPLLLVLDEHGAVVAEHTLSASAPSAAISYDAQHDIAVVARGDALELVSLTSGARAVVALAQEEWIITDPEGIFDGSPNADALGVYIDPRRPEEGARSLDQLALHANRPDLIASALGVGAPASLDYFARKQRSRLVKADLLPIEIPEHDAAVLLAGLNRDERRRFEAVYRRHGDRYLRSDASTVERYGLMAVDAFADYVRLHIREVSDLDPPLVYVGRPDSGSAALRIVPAPGTPAAAVPRVRVNGVPVDSTQEVPLLPGRTVVEVTMAHPSGTESLPARHVVKAPRSEQPPDIYFVGFGVSDYADDRLDLLYAAKDAVDLGSLVTEMPGFTGRHVRTYADRACTRSAFADAETFLARARPQDTVVVFLAGHGMYDRAEEPTYYFLTHETDLQNLPASAVAFSRIENLIASTPALNRLVLMDTCESGELDDEILLAATVALGDRSARARTVRGLSLGATDGATSTVARQENAAAAATGGTPAAGLLGQARFVSRDVFPRTGAVFFSASQGGELSYEPAAFDESENGYFTAAVISAISGGAADANLDGLISASELRGYVRRTVSARTGGRQNPTVDRDNAASSVSLAVVGEYHFRRLDAARLDDALRTAVANGGVRAAQALLAAGADPNIGYANTRPLVSTAAARGDAPMVATLLDAGANPYAYDDDRWNTFLFAVRNDHLDVAQLLIDGRRMAETVDPESLSAFMEHPVYLAARYASVAMIELLVDSGVPLHPVPKSALVAAAERNASEVVRALLDAGMDPDTATDTGFIETPLAAAVRFGHLEVARMLLEAGADPDAAGDEQWRGQRLRPLAAAAEAGDAEAFLVLLSGPPGGHGATIMAEDLTLAVRSGSPEVVSLILESGIEPAAEHPRLAVALGHLEVARLLVQFGSPLDVIDPLHEASLLAAAAFRMDQRMLEWLLGAGLAIDGTAELSPGSPRHPLAAALSLLWWDQMRGAEAVVDMFVAHGVSPGDAAEMLRQARE